jgi:hypothetical protein
MNNKLVPALIGGAILGILSSIPIVNYCCCLWAIGGGALAVMFYVKNTPNRVSVGEGAMLGALAGVVGGVIYFVLGSIIGIIFGAAQMEQAFRQAGIHNMPLSGTALILLGTFIAALCLVGLATVGGLIGVPIFEKRKDGDVPPPPPPPAYGGDQPGGGYAGGGGGYQGGGGGYGAGT